MDAVSWLSSENCCWWLHWICSLLRPENSWYSVNDMYPDMNWLSQRYRKTPFSVRYWVENHSVVTWASV